MIERFAARVLLLLLSGFLVLPPRSAESAPSATATPTSSEAASEGATNSFRRITPGPIDGRIAFLTAAMLEKNHYLKLPFDATVSSKFLDTYLNTLDPQHINFTQADVAEFERYRTNLDRLTLTERHLADTRPACEIFNRFFERLSQRTAYVNELLKNDKFTFDGNERMAINRKELPYPKDLDEAKKLWRERLRFEYLQELLGKIEARKKKEALAARKKASSPQANGAPRPLATEAGTGAYSAGGGSRVTQTNLQLVTAPGPDQDPQRSLQSPKGSEQWQFFHPAAGQPRGPVAKAPAVEPAATDQAQRAASGDGNRSAEAAARAVGSTATETNEAATAAPAKTDAEEIASTLIHRYHRNLRFFEDWNNEDVLQIYLTALAHVYDPHSDYLGRAQLESFAMAMNLSLFGIGAELTVSEDGYCTIRRLLPGGPAIKSKRLKEKDRIIAVAQGDEPPVDIVDLSLNKAVQLIRGAKGTEVRLTIIPEGGGGSDRKVVSLIRDEIRLEEAEAKAKIIELPNAHGENLRLGVIDLPSFYATFPDMVNSKDKPEPKSTTVDVARLLAKLEKEKVAGVILDLRRNGGGSLEEAIKLTGLFIKTGPVVQVKEGRSVQEADDTDPSVLYDGPLLVLTSRGSASASEIVAGALQDYGRALIVGDCSTHGKGTVQSVNQLGPLMHLLDRSLTNEPGALKLTIKKFYRPSGASTQLRGVVPDIILPSLANESKDIGESALDNPLPWDDIPSAKYDHLNLVEPYLAELRKRSAERVAADPEYGYVREDIERYRKQQADKTISLNERVRLKETEELDARNKARDQERRARAEPQEKVYELTLKDVDSPGLPPPVGQTNTVTSSVSLPAVTAPAGVATNSASVAVVSPASEDNLDDSTEAPAPAPDEPLLEAERILMDYLSVLPKGDLVTAGK